MRLLLAAFVALAVLSIGQVRAAEETCYTYTIIIGGKTGTGGSRAEACSSAASQISTANTNSSQTVSVSLGATGTDAGTWGCTGTWTQTNHTVMCPPNPSHWCYTSEAYGPHTGGGRTAVECAPDPCEAAASDPPKMMSGSGSSIPTSSCESTGEGGGGCAYEPDGVGVSAGGVWVQNMKATGSSCSVANAEADKGDCIRFGGSGGSGGFACATKPGQACGEVNGKSVCLDKVPDGRCEFLGDGGMVCASDAPAAPDNGTPGTPATPDATLKGTDGKTVNYYSNSTVNSSSTGGAGAVGGKPGGVGDGSGSGEGDGEGEGEGDGECDDGACEGSLPGDLEGLDSFATITQGFMERVGSAGVVASVATLGSSLPAGACPNWTFDVFDREISLSAPMCTIWDSISGLLSAVMLVAWGLLAARIVLTA